MALKWYTRARKFPQLIGRAPDGTRIPGGPYTYTQVLAGGVAALLMAQTTWLWARGGLIGNATIFLAVVAGVIYGVGKLPPGMRNPLVLTSGLFNLAKRGYQLDGKPLPIRKPEGVTTVNIVLEPIGKPPRPAPAAPPTPPVAAALPEPASPALSGIQRLLLEKE